MGDNSDKKKSMGHLFFMRNPYMKFQNIIIHDSKHAIHNNAITLNGQKKTITPTTFRLVGSKLKFKQVISSPFPISTSNIKAPAQIHFEISY